jgi:MFS family permease
MTRNGRLLFGAALISSAGDWMYRLALPILVYELTHSAVAVAATYALEYAPYVIVGPLGGVVADRFDRRRLLLGGDAAAAFITGVLAIACWLDLDSVGLVYVSALLLAGIAPCYHPAFQSILPSVVEERLLPAAAARLQGIDSVTAFIGPLVGGMLIVHLGVTVAIGLNALTFMISALCMLGLRVKSHATADATAAHHIVGDLKAALGHIRNDSMIFTATWLFAGVNLAAALLQGNMVYYLVEFRHQDASQVGVVLAAQGVGALVGAIAAPRLTKFLRPGSLILVSVVAIATASALLLAAASLATIALAWGLQAAAATITAVTWFTLRLQRIPAHLLGRVVALTRMVAFAVIPVGSLVGAVLIGSDAGIGSLIVIAVLVQLALAAVGLLSPLNDGLARRRGRPTTSVVAAEP